MADDIKQRRAYAHEIAQALWADGYVISFESKSHEEFFNELSAVLNATQCAALHKKLPAFDVPESSLFVRKENGVVTDFVRCSYLSDDGLIQRDSVLNFYDARSDVPLCTNVYFAEEYASRKPVRRVVRRCATRLACILGA